MYTDILFWQTFDKKITYETNYNCVSPFKHIFRVVVILSGGNIDSKVMAQLLTNKKNENPKKRFFF